MGKYAKKAVCKTYGFNQKDYLYEPVKIGKHERYFVFLPHPNSRVARTLKGTLHPKQTGQQFGYLFQMICESGLVRRHIFSTLLLPLRSLATKLSNQIVVLPN